MTIERETWTDAKTGLEIARLRCEDIRTSIVSIVSQDVWSRLDRAMAAKLELAKKFGAPPPTKPEWWNIFRLQDLEANA